MIGDSEKKPSYLKKCYLTECKNKAEFLTHENGHQIRLCKKHYDIHQNKHQKITKINFRKASELDQS